MMNMSIAAETAQHPSPIFAAKVSGTAEKDVIPSIEYPRS